MLIPNRFLFLIAVTAATVLSCTEKPKQLGADPDVSYFITGKLRTSEIKEESMTFRVKVSTLDQQLIDKPIGIRILDTAHFELSYRLNNKAEIKTGMFGQTFRDTGIEVQILKNGSWSSNAVESIREIYYTFRVKGAEQE